MCVYVCVGHLLVLIVFIPQWLDHSKFVGGASDYVQGILIRMSVFIGVCSMQCKNELLYNWRDYMPPLALNALILLDFLFPDIQKLRK